MTYQIIGCAKQAFTSKKNNKKYLPISVSEKSLDYFGLKVDSLLLSEDVLQNADVQTDSGEIYAPDGKKYFVDVDYNNRGFIIGLRFYNG